MNKLLITVLGALTIGITLPTFAGPDWPVIEHARKAKQEAQAARQGAMSTQATDSRQCLPDAGVLLLDHGPRAQSTPYLNRLRQERYEAQVKACHESMK